MNWSIVSDRVCQLIAICSIVATWFGWQPSDAQIVSAAFVGLGMSFSASARIAELEEKLKTK